MRCRICDEGLRDDEIKDDSKTGKLRECDKCWAVIQDSLEGMERRDKKEELDDVLDIVEDDFVLSGPREMPFVRIERQSL